MEAIQVIEHDHVEGGRRRAFLLVAAHMEVLVVCAAIGQAMDQPRVTVKGEDHRLVLGEEDVEITVGEPVRVLACRLQFHQIHHVDHADSQLRSVLPEKFYGRQGLQRGHVAAAGHHHVGVRAPIVARPLPDPDPGRAVLDRLIHGQPLRRRLLAGYDHVHVVAASQAVVRHAQERIGIRRQVDPDHLRFLVHDVIDKTGVLVAEAVVILPPHERGQEIVQRRNGRRQGIPRVTLSHLACWLNIESMMWMNAS